MDEHVSNQPTDDVSQQPVPSVRVGTKEGGVTAVIEHSETEPQIREELREFVHPSEKPVPKIPEVGLMPAADSVKPNISSPTAQFAMTPDEAKEIVKKGQGKEIFDPAKQFEGIGFMSSKFALAVLTFKNFIKNMQQKLTRQTA